MTKKMKVLTTSSDKRTQFDKFKEAARELECDDDEARFKERLGKLVEEKGAGKSETPVVASKGPRRGR